MAWFANTPQAGAGTGLLHGDDDWLHDEDDPQAAREGFDPVEQLRRRMETLGQNEGLERGIAQGEARGFQDGFRMEAARSAMLGRCLGAARVVCKARPLDHELQTAVQEAERVAREKWAIEPGAVDAALARVYELMDKAGVKLPEWPIDNSRT